MIGAAYIRVSTDDQTEYSPDSQLRLIRDRAKHDGVIIPDDYVFADDGISGRSADKRPSFRLMISTAKQDPPPFQVIYVWKFSRFTRNQEESILYKNLLKRRGVDVVSISEPSSDSPFSSLIERIIEWMDEYYILNLAEEIRRGMKEKSLRGEANGRPPFGYDVKEKRLVPNESAETVRAIFESYSNGASLRSLSMRYGISTSVMRYILRNPAYVGKIRWEDQRQKYSVIDYRADLASLPDGKHEPIIDMDLWNSVQNRLNKRSYDPKYVRSGDYLLKGLVRCGSCGSTLTRICGTDSALQCTGYRTGKCTVSHYATTSMLMDKIVQQIEAIVDDPDYTFAPPKPRTDYQKYIDAEKAKIRRAKSAYLAGAFTVEEYAEIKKSSEAVIAEYEAPVDTSELKEKTASVIGILKSDASPEMKNQALRSICEKIVYTKPDVDIYISFEN